MGMHLREILESDFFYDKVLVKGLGRIVQGVYLRIPIGAQ